MRKGEVYYKDNFAGLIQETVEGEYVFEYDGDYARDHAGDFLVFSMPVRIQPYRSSRLFPFFDGLIPEGWLLDIAAESWKINPNDRMGLLLACCQNCIGAVSVKPVEPKEKADE